MNRRYQSLVAKPMHALTQMSYGALFLLWIVLAILFGCAYFLLATYVPEHGPKLLVADADIVARFWDSLYYSIITATSTGYGDITPNGLSKLLASMQSISALMIFAIFVTKLVSHRQEIALREVHRLTFEDVFHNTREGLYIIRKDCDRIAQDAEEHGALSDDHWHDLIIAYRHGQSLLKEIPDFYASSEKEGYIIDPLREKLLHEAVHRTLRRVNQMLDTLSRKSISWADHEESLAELRGLLSIVDAITPHWQEDSPYTEAFEDILHVSKSIHSRIQDTAGGKTTQAR